MAKTPLKHKYVIFATLDIKSSEYVRIMYSDLQGKDNIRFVDSPFDNCRHKRFFHLLHKYHFHGYLNRFFELPLKSLWNKFYYNERCEDSNDLCFVFFMSSLVKSNESFFRYLKKKYPGCKLVVYFEDIVASRNRKGGNPLRLDYIEKYFDLAITYDQGDSSEYGFLHYPTPYSVIDIQSNPSVDKSDLFFCGAAKQRHDLIVDIYNTCVSNSLKCDFIVTRYSGDKKRAGIEYVSYMMPYSEYLEHMNQTNCLLDVIQSGSRGFTVRVWEALVYGKKMLTNNREILIAPFYDARQFCYFETIGEKELDFIKKRDVIERRFAEELSPLRLLEFVETHLEKKA